MNPVSTDAKVINALQTITNAKVVQYPVGNDTNGNTIYQPGYVLGGSAENPEYCFDNHIQQRCTVPAHRVAELLPKPTPAPAGK